MADKSDTPAPKKQTKPKAESTAPKTTRQTKPKAESSTAKTTRQAKPKTESAAPKTARQTKPKTESAPKVKKQTKQEPEVITENTGNSKFAAIFYSKKMRVILIAALALLLIIAASVGIALGVKSCNKDIGGDIIEGGTEGGIEGGGDQLHPGDPYEDRTAGEEHYYSPAEVAKYNPSSYNDNLVTNTIVGVSGLQIGTVERNIPQTTRNEGLSVYPKFGSTLSAVIGTTEDKVAARNALIRESSYLTATGTSNAGGGGYTFMDSSGYLYSGTVAEPVETLDSEGNHRRLYKHTASIGLYLGDVADDEPGIIKEVTIRPRGYNGYSVTGVYAPAGEVIKIQISEEDMNATGGLTIHIGQALYNGQANNIWSAKNQMQRIPHLLNTMSVNKNTATLENGVYTAYVGSFIGGPLYIRNTNATYTATISGGVAYRNFILGYTTPEEFAQTSKSSAPYFDLEVWDRGVLHSGPVYYAKSFSYEDLYKAAVLWDKVASVTTYGSNQGIVFLYEPFVAAGAAVAFPGRRSVNCPMSWMPSSLNYNAIVTSGSWGNFHEYHHNFQGYGVGNGGEVTNNGLTLVSYSLFTKISSKRGISSFGAQGLGGWNNYTSATWALEETLKIARPDESPSNGNQGLALYATLLHNFGQDAYMKAKVAGGGQSYAAYMNAWQSVTHNNMYYYFNDVLKGTGISNNADPSYPMFVPVSSVYQTGRSYTYDGEKKYFKTMQPYVITYGEDFLVDLRKYTAPNGQYAGGSVVLPDGFTYTVKSITQPEHGEIIPTNVYGVYVYRPDKQNLLSGDIKVTLGITKDDGAFTVDDVELVLGFEQSHETNKSTLNRTTYTYSADAMYKDAVTAYESNFAGFSDKNERDHSNPTQNCNTDIWFYPDTPENRNKYPNAPEEFFFHDNTIEIIDGKLYVESEGKYRIFLRGRLNCALYYSLDGGKTYSLGASVKNGSGDKFYLNDPESYFDVEVSEGDVSDGGFWIYIREVLIVQSANRSYIGVGMSPWTEPQYTMVEKYYNADGKEVDADSEDIDPSKTKTVYYDNSGKEVDPDVVAAAEKIPPTSASYVNAYRLSYKFPDNKDFETDYFYVREYNYTYTVKHDNLTSQSHVGASPCPDNYPIENLFDNDLTTACSSTAVVSANAPWTVTVDLGKTITANRAEITGRLNNGASNQNQTPTSFTFYVGETLDSMKEVFSVENGKVNGITSAFNFETSTFRYYRIVVTKTVQGRYAAIANVLFTNNVTGGKKLTPDDEILNYEGSWNCLNGQSTYGHVYVGKSGSSLSFEFTGTRLGIFSTNEFGKNYEVYIDGKKVDSIELATSDDFVNLSYFTDALTNGKHRVEIKCTGEANIDSIVIF